MEGLNELALFAGAGGGILGGKLLGWRTVCAVEIDEYCRYVLIQRQNDGILKPFPIWDDVCTFDGKPWKGIVDVVSGGFPCQDISCAGKGAGIEGKRSGLWGEMARIIGEVRPQYVFVENVPLLISRGLTTVLSDLAEMGYDARWCLVSAENCGAPHRRDRIWILANASRGKLRNEPRGRRGAGGKGAPKSGNNGAQSDVADADQSGPQGRHCGELQERHGELFTGKGGSQMADSAGVRREKSKPEIIPGSGQNKKNKRGMRQLTRDGSGMCEWWQTEPSVGRVAHGVAHRVQRLKALGNGQVPICAAVAWRILMSDG